MQISQRMEWLRAIVADENVKDSAVRVAVALANYANAHDGTAWPSLTTLAKNTTLERRSTYRAANQLVSLGYLKRVRKGGPGRGPTLYKLIGTRVSLQVGTGESLHRDRGVPYIGTGVSPEPGKEPVIEPTRDAAEQQELQEPDWKSMHDGHRVWWGREMGKPGLLAGLDSRYAKREAEERLSSTWRDAYKRGDFEGLRKVQQKWQPG